MSEGKQWVPGMGGHGQRAQECPGWLLDTEWRGSPAIRMTDSSNDSDLGVLQLLGPEQLPWLSSALAPLWAMLAALLLPLALMNQRLPLCLLMSWSCQRLVQLTCWWVVPSGDWISRWGDQVFPPLPGFAGRP